MPIYEYQCAVCGHQLEAFQKITDQPLKECPTCHKTTLNKLISATTFQLKGTGWYATDFKDKGKPKATEATEGTQDGKKESKEAAATKPEAGAKENAKQAAKETVTSDKTKPTTTTKNSTTE